MSKPLNFVAVAFGGGYASEAERPARSTLAGLSKSTARYTGHVPGAGFKLDTSYIAAAQKEHRKQ